MIKECSLNIIFLCFLINISSKECISCLTLLKGMYAGGKSREGSWWCLGGWTQKRKHYTQTWCSTNVWTHHWRGMEVFKMAATRWLLAQRNTYTHWSVLYKNTHFVVRPRFCLRTDYWAQRSWRKQVHKELLDVNDRSWSCFWGQMFDKQDLKKESVVGRECQAVSSKHDSVCKRSPSRRSVAKRRPRLPGRVFSDIRQHAHLHAYAHVSKSTCTVSETWLLFAFLF